jgi:hypothetical protein
VMVAGDRAIRKPKKSRLKNNMKNIQRSNVDSFS